MISPDEIILPPPRTDVSAADFWSRVREPNTVDAKGKVTLHRLDKRDTRRETLFGRQDPPFSTRFRIQPYQRMPVATSRDIERKVLRKELRDLEEDELLKKLSEPRTEILRLRAHIDRVTHINLLLTERALAQM